MKNENFPVNRIHGKMSSEERNKITDEFRSGSSRVLITSDLFARGIDVQQVSIVINFDIPKSPQQFTHRSGRSGRYGRKGITINFVTFNDIKILKEIEEYYNIEIEEMPEDLSPYMN